MLVLVTGFEPYGGRDFNPAYDIMQALDGRTVAGAAIVGRSLPVSLAPLTTMIEGLLDEIAPSAVISLGLSPGEASIRIERLGVNIADFDIADNQGVRLRDGEVFANGSAARFATLPVRAIEDKLLAAGIPARLSMTAGAFLCNACLYMFLHALEQRALPCPCGFIHVPYTPEQVATMLRTGHGERRDLASMDLSRMIRAIEIAIAETVRALAEAAPVTA
jgi:pyroglutamyl-peptidase